MGGGPFGVESRLQRQAMSELTKEDCFREFMEYTHWNCNARLVHDYFWKSGDTIDWLEDMGVQFEQAGKFYAGSWNTWHKVAPDGGGRSGPRAAATMTRHMAERAAELGVQIYTNTPVKQLIKTGDTVTGLIADCEGDILHSGMQAVIFREIFDFNHIGSPFV